MEADMLAAAELRGRRLQAISFSEGAVLVMTAAYITISVLGVAFNMLTIPILITGKNLSKEVTIQLTNLSIANLIAAAFVPYYLMQAALHLDFPHSDVLCKIVSFVGRGALNTSPLWNMAIALERIFVVYFPLRAFDYTRGHKVIVAISVWLVGYLPEIEALYYARVEPASINSSSVSTCVLPNPMMYSQPLLYEVLVSVKYILPPIIIAISYLLIGIKLLCRHQIGEGGGKTGQKTAAGTNRVYRLIYIG